MGMIICFHYYRSIFYNKHYPVFSRVTDFQIQIQNPKQPYGSATLNLTWTAPGDDLTFGRAFQYKIYCGYQRFSLSYDNCKSISKTVLFAHIPGTTEILVETDFRDFDKEIFFAIRTLDGINESEQSNIVSVFVESLRTTTSKGLIICSQHAVGQKILNSPGKKTCEIKEIKLFFS